MILDFSLRWLGKANALKQKNMSLVLKMMFRKAQSQTHQKILSPIWQIAK